MKTAIEHTHGETVAVRWIAACAAVALVSIAGSAMLFDRPLADGAPLVAEGTLASVTGEVDQSTLHVPSRYETDSLEPGAAIAAYERQ